MEIRNNYAYGVMKGYETNATMNALDNVAPLKMHISFFADAEQKRNIEAAIRNLALKFFKMEFTPYGLSLGFNDITMNKLLQRLPAILDAIYGILSSNGALGRQFCPVCGKELLPSASKTCNVDGFQFTIDNDCVDTINTVISAENAAFENAPNNYLKGFLGALIGALAGAAVAVLLYAVGFVSALSAVVSIFLGTFLYRKFHGKPNKVMIVIVSITTLVLMAATIPAIYITAAGISAKEAGVSMSALEAFKICMEDSEFSRWFYCDLALILLFSVIGIVGQIFVLAKQVKRKKNI